MAKISVKINENDGKYSLDITHNEQRIVIGSYTLDDLRQISFVIRDFVQQKSLEYVDNLVKNIGDANGKNS